MFIPVGRPLTSKTSLALGCFVSNALNPPPKSTKLMNQQTFFFSSHVQLFLLCFCLRCHPSLRQPSKKENSPLPNPLSLSAAFPKLKPPPPSQPESSSEDNTSCFLLTPQTPLLCSLLFFLSSLQTAPRTKRPHSFSKSRLSSRNLSKKISPSL